MYKRTVSICGVTFKRESALKYSTDRFDGSLLYQFYLVLEICYRESSVYSDIPVAIAAQTFREDKAQFGASEKEKGKFEPGKVTSTNSINFTKGFFEISRDFDHRHDTGLTRLIMEDISKYSYPFLSIQRKRGLVPFVSYSYHLARATSINQSWHYYFYTIALALLGERLCDKAILTIKKTIGSTPNL